MNLNSIINMVINRIMRVVINKGINSGINSVSGLAKKGMSKNEESYEDDSNAPEMKIDRKRARSIKRRF